MVRLVSLRILESYFRHRWLYFLPMLLMLVIAVASFFLIKPKYLAGGVLFVEKESLLSTLISVRETSFSWDTPADETSTEISEMMQTNAFVRAVIRMTDLEENMDEGETAVAMTISDVRKITRTESLGNNQVFVAAEHTDPQVAYQLVNAIIENYIQWKINAARVESVTAQDFFGDLITQYEVAYEVTQREIENYLIAHPQPVRGDRPEIETIEIERLQSALQLAEQRYAKAIENDENAQLSLSQAESDVRQTYFFIDAPKIPNKPSTSLKDRAIQIAIFGVAGMILSGVGVVGSALLDRSLLFPVDVQHGLNLPVLTAVPNAVQSTPGRRQKIKGRAGKKKQHKKTKSHIQPAFTASPETQK